MSSGTCSLPILDSDLFCSTSVEGIKIISSNSFQQEKCITKNAESEMKTKQKGISCAQTNETIKNYFDQDFIETNNSINSINQQNQLISSQRKSFKLENYKDTNDSIAHMSMISTTHVFSVSKKHRRNSLSLDQLNGNAYLKEHKQKLPYVDGLQTIKKKESIDILVPSHQKNLDKSNPLLNKSNQIESSSNSNDETNGPIHKELKISQCKSDNLKSSKNARKRPFVYSTSKKSSDTTASSANNIDNINRTKDINDGSKNIRYEYSFNVTEGITNLNSRNSNFEDSAERDNHEIEKIVENLTKLKRKGKRKIIIDSYLKTLMKFQKCMFCLQHISSLVLNQQSSKRSEGELILAKFASKYLHSPPPMKFYKIENLPLIQGFDLISSLFLSFKYCGIEFMELPITYQLIFGNVEICMMWYDKSLKEKLLSFYVHNIELFQLKLDYLKLYVLPVTLLQDQRFSKIIENQESFRLNITLKLIHKSELISQELCQFLFDSRYHISDNRRFFKQNYKLKCFDHKLKEELKYDIEQCDKLLEDYIGYEAIPCKHPGVPKYSINLLNSVHQHSMIAEVDLNKCNCISRFYQYSHCGSSFREEFIKIINECRADKSKIIDIERKFSSNHAAFDYKFPLMMFKYKDSDVLNDEASISPILLENLKHASFISNKFIDDIDYKSHNRYFKSDKDLKIFIKFCSQNMIPVDVFWCSNLKGTGIRCRVYDLTHSKIKCDEASNLLSELTADKPSFLDENAKINITSLEQLKFLEAVSKDIEKDYLNNPKREYRDLIEFSKRENPKERHINMNMFFNEDIVYHHKNYEITKLKGNLFANKESGLSLEYLNDIQIVLKEKAKNVFKEICKKNRSDCGKLATNAHHIAMSNRVKIPNINASYMTDHFMKLKELYCINKKNGNNCIEDVSVSVAGFIRTCTDLLYSAAERIANNMIFKYKSLNNECIVNKSGSFKNAVESILLNRELKCFVQQLNQIKFTKLKFEYNN